LVKDDINPQAARSTVAQAIGFDEKNVTSHVTLLGGSAARSAISTRRRRRRAHAAIDRTLARPWELWKRKALGK
jgi:hypothetical protein